MDIMWLLHLWGEIYPYFGLGHNAFVLLQTAVPRHIKVDLASLLAAEIAEILVLIGISGIVRLNGKGKCSVAVLPPQVKPRDLLSAEPGKGLGQVQLGVVVVFSGKLRQGMAAFVPVFKGDRAQL